MKAPKSRNSNNHEGQRLWWSLLKKLELLSLQILAELEILKLTVKTPPINIFGSLYTQAGFGQSCKNRQDIRQIALRSRTIVGVDFLDILFTNKMMDAWLWIKWLYYTLNLAYYDNNWVIPWYMIGENPLKEKENIPSQRLSLLSVFA